VRVPAPAGIRKRRDPKQRTGGATARESNLEGFG